MDRSCKEFVGVLGSKSTVPGGGGASALAGAVGIALGNMVGALTVGKRKYAKVEKEMEALCREADSLQMELLVLIEKDALAFKPLAEAYSMPVETEGQRLEKERVMEERLLVASTVPMEIMKKCTRAIEMHRIFGEKGNNIAISDVGAGVVICYGALRAASFNIFINTAAMKDRLKAEILKERAEAMIKEYGQMTEEIVALVKSKI